MELIRLPLSKDRLHIRRSLILPASFLNHYFSRRRSFLPSFISFLFYFFVAAIMSRSGENAHEIIRTLIEYPRHRLIATTATETALSLSCVEPFLARYLRANFNINLRMPGGKKFLRATDGQATIVTPLE